jgi:hypothetical protein
LGDRLGTPGAVGFFLFSFYFFIFEKISLAKMALLQNELLNLGKSKK